MFERLRDLLAETCGVNPAAITRETQMRDIVRGSLDLVEVVMAIEEEFDFEVPDADAEEFDLLRLTVGEVADHLVRYRGHSQ
jgi:acyl carrier protein